MRKKNQEVTGKPTQYNLQTLEYNWGELPEGQRFAGRAEQKRAPPDLAQNIANRLGGPPKEVKKEAKPMMAVAAPQQEDLPGPSDNMYRVADAVDSSYQDNNYDRGNAQANAQYNGNGYANAAAVDYNNRGGQAQPSAPAQMYGILWSHEDIKRMNQINYTEARQSYFRWHVQALKKDKKLFTVTH